jgi:hypothetical protein
MEWLKRQLNRMGLLSGAASPPAPLVPDLSLIRDYDRGISEQENPSRTAYARHFYKGDKHLYYVAAGHELGPENATFKTVREAMARGKPQLIILEGFPTQAGVSPVFYQDYVQKKAAENFHTAEEPEYTAHLAMQNNIPFIGGEPTDQEIFKQMNEKGYSDKDTAAFYLLRWIPRWVEQQGVTEKDFDKKAQDYLDHFQYYHDANVPPEKRLTVDEFKAWYAEHNDQPGRHFLQINSENVAPVRSQFASYFEKMSAATGEIRERHLDTAIGNAFKDHDNVLVVYGSGHLVQSRKVFEQMFGNAENIRVC